MADEMVTLSIDGREVTVPKGTTIIEAAKNVGTKVPHYCYHPGLSSPAMCRLCLVEVEGAPKLMPACVTQVGDGQVVHTESERARQMRRGVLEFYLVNHPLDCPICDQSGECKLQDYVNAEGRVHGRSREPKRVFGRDDFGGDVLFYGDRCVMCTRCVRFMNEVAQDPRLTVVERGSRSIIDTFFDHGLEGSPFATNIVDICPVGALVSKDFLYKARAWDLDHTPSVCPSCSQGCNIDLHSRDNLIQRLKPRENQAVNGFWMCDYGRENYEWLNHPDRAEVPLVRGNSGQYRATDWGKALESLTERAGALENPAITVVANSHASNEDLAQLRAWAEAIGTPRLVYRSRRTDSEEPLPGFPTLVRRTELSPNERGASLLGFERVGDEHGRGGLDPVAGGVVIVLDDGLDDFDGADAFEAADLFIVFATDTRATDLGAHYVLPVTTFAESEGTFTNHAGRVQRFWSALQAPGAARPTWLITGALAAHLRGEGGPVSAEEAFAKAGELAAAFAGIEYADIGTNGALVNEPVQLAGD
jgi:NADH-quinone oxidoreductase subunit G